MPSKRSLTTLALVVLVVLAGCSGAGNSAGGSADLQASGGDGGAATAAPEEAEASGGGSGGAKDASGEYQVAQTNRALIRTGQITLRVDDFESTRANLTERVRESGGFVSDTNQRSDEIGNETYTRGTVVLRVPAGNFSTFFDAVTAEGEVLESSTNTQDVTDQLVDIEARLNNLRAQRDRLREMYENANDTEDVLAVSRELSRVQGEIERLEAQQRNLERKVALATITVTLREERPEPDFEPPERWYDTPVLQAFLDSVDGAIVALRAVVVGFAYALPYLVVFGGPLALLGSLVYRWRRGRYPWSTAAVSDSDSESPDDDADELDGDGDDDGDGGADADDNPADDEDGLSGVVGSDESDESENENN